MAYNSLKIRMLCQNTNTGRIVYQAFASRFVCYFIGRGRFDRDENSSDWQIQSHRHQRNRICPCPSAYYPKNLLFRTQALSPVHPRVFLLDGHACWPPEI